MSVSSEIIIGITSCMYRWYSRKTTSAGIVIGKNVWRGVSYVIMDGVTIEDDYIVGLNSEVTASLSARSVAQGSPAKRIFERR